MAAADNVLAVYNALFQDFLPRPRVFRDRTNPFEIYSDEEIYDRFRFQRRLIIQILDLVEDRLVLHQRLGRLRLF